LFDFNPDLTQSQESHSLAPLADNEVTVRITSTGLCGSDLHYYTHFRNGDIHVRSPLILGHESCGYVTAIGPSVTHLKPGDFVALEVGLPCGICHLCLEGRYNICPALRFRSSAKSWPHFQGTLQTKLNHPAERCYRLPEGFNGDMGAIIEPLSVAMHASRRAGLPRGSTVLVFGAGAVGLLCAAVAKAAGQRVIIADIQASRVHFATTHRFADAGVVVPMQKAGAGVQEKLSLALEVAGTVGRTRLADFVLSSAGQEREVEAVDAVFECTGQESCLQAAIYATRPGGKIMLIGMGTPVQTLPISAAALREVDLLGVFRYADVYEDAIRLVASRDPLLPDLGRLVTQRFRGLGEVGEAFEMAGRGWDGEGGLVIKVVVEFPEEDGETGGT